MTEKVKFHDVQVFNHTVNDDAEHLNVKGYAIHTGRFHGIIEIPESEIQNATNTLNGRKIFNNHEYSTEDVLGKILSTNKEIDPYNTKAAVSYNGYIDKNENKIIYKIKNGLLDSTSIGFEFEPECGICGKPLEECHHFIWDEGFYVIARNINVLELSVVGIPADKDATVEAMTFSKNQFLEDLQDQFKYKFKAHKGDSQLNQELVLKQGLEATQNFDLVEEVTKSIKSDKMADNDKVLDLQEKLKEANDKITSLSDTHKEEIKTLKEELEAEKSKEVGKLQDQIVEEKGKAIESKTELDKLQGEVEEYKETIKDYESKFEDLDRKRLSDKREKLQKLHKDITKEDIEDLDEMDEKFMDKTITMLEKAKENQGVVKRFNKGKNPYKKVEEGKETENLESFLGSKFGQ